jgi:NADH-quinone oxidoreductase subunit C
LAEFSGGQDLPATLCPIHQNQRKTVLSVSRTDTIGASGSLVGESMAEREVLKKVKERFPSELLDSRVFRDEATLVVQKDAIVEVLQYLHDDFAFELLTDLCGVDRYTNHPRFEVVYHLYSIKRNERLRVKASLGEGESISTVESIWKGANWYEREAFDMLGIVFENHSNLKRILMWDEFDGYPLRKDFPTEGKDFKNPVLPDG